MLTDGEVKHFFIVLLQKFTFFLLIIGPQKCFYNNNDDGNNEEFFFSYFCRYEIELERLNKIRQYREINDKNINKRFFRFL